ncbi:MAG: hypothetical protein BYD32DRAFT_456522 [Podila humilis]|nr:MAG: hypothetical protein BYD32DRAFT_456522 [Podila humilis]
MPRKKASPKAQDLDQSKSKKPSPKKQPAPRPRNSSQKNTTTATPVDIPNESTSEGTSIEATPQGISSDSTPNDTSLATTQSTSNHVASAIEPLRSPTVERRSRVKSGPKPKLRFKARDYTAPWRIQFDRRRPATNPDGSMTLRPYVPLTQYFQTPAQQAAMRARRREVQDPDAIQNHDNQGRDGSQEPDFNQIQDQDIIMSAPNDTSLNNEEAPIGSTTTTTTTRDKGKWMRVQPAIPRPVPYFKREIAVPGHNPDNDQTYTVDLPAMEDPYLQEAFPYSYPFKDETTQFMPIEWYMPQGPFAAEDFFSMQKLQYSSSIMKTMKFRNEGLPLEQYYARGFDLASKVVLDRERSRRIKEHKAARPDNPLMQPIETILASIQAVGEASAVPAPTPVSVLTSTAASTSASTPAMDPSGGSTSQPSASMDGQRTNSVHPTATPDQPNTTTYGAGTASDQNITAISRSRNTSEQPNTTAAQPSSTTQEGNEVTLLDYYQVNKFIETIFETNADIRHTPPVPLSKGACRILQTLLGDIETKIVAMGCHRQRKELTRLLAERDAVNVQVAAKAAEAAKITSDAAAAAATVVEDVPSMPVIKSRKGRRKRENPVDEMHLEQNVGPGYRYKRLHVDDMDEYMEKWVQSRDRHNRARESSVDPQTPTTTTSPKKRKLEGSETTEEVDQDMPENSPDVESSEIATPRERSLLFSDSDGDEPQSEQGSRKAPKPFIDDPMQIGTSMDPFLKARDFLANRFFQEQARNASRERSAEASQSGLSSAP